MTLIVLGLSDFQGGVEVVVWEMGAEDFMSVITEEGRLETARCRLEAVEELQFATNGLCGLR